MDDEIRIRVDVETATLGQLRDALKGVRTEMNTASRSDIPELRREANSYAQQIKTLSGTHSELAQTIRSSRQEARLFRFAITELIAGVDGMVNAFTGLTGASDTAQKAVRDYAGAVKDAVGAGIGLKFGLDAINVPGAGPIALAAAGFTFLGDIIKNMRLEMEAAAKASTSLLGKMIPGMNWQDLEAQREAAQARLSVAQGGVTSLEALRKKQGDIVFLATGGPGRLKAAHQEVLNAQAALNLITEAEKAITDDPRAAVNYIEDQYKAGAMDEPEYVRELQLVASWASAKAQTRLEQDIQNRIKDLSDKRNKERDQYNAARLKYFEKYSADQIAADYQSPGAMKPTPNLPQMGVPSGSLAPIQTYTDTQIAAAKAFANGLNAAFTGVGQSITQNLLKPLSDAHSLAQIFIRDLLQGLAQALERLLIMEAIKGALSLVPGGAGAFATIFSSAGGGGLAPRTASLFGGGGGGGGGGAVEHTIRVVQSGRDMVGTIKLNRVIDRKLGGNF